MPVVIKRTGNSVARRLIARWRYGCWRTYPIVARRYVHRGGYGRIGGFRGFVADNMIGIAETFYDIVVFADCREF